MSLRLDKSRPYGEVSPPYLGAHYEQGGIYFRANGQPVDGDEGDELHGKDAKKKIAAATKISRANEAARKAYAKEMADQTETEGQQMAREQVEAAEAAMASGNYDPSQIAGGDGTRPGGPDMQTYNQGVDDTMSDAEKKDEAKRSIIAWAAGTAPVPFYALRKFFETLGVKVTSMDQARTQAVQQGYVAADNIKV